MRTRQGRFAAVFFLGARRRYNDGGVEHPSPGGWTITRFPDHPIDGAALVFAEGRPAFNPECPGIAKQVLAGVSLAGNTEPSEVHIEAGLSLHVQGATAQAAALDPHGDTARGVFQRGGAEMLPVRVGWRMVPGVLEAPDVAMVHAHIHPVGLDEWALQFMSDEARDGAKREGSMFASGDFGVPLATTESVTFGVPWMGPYREVWATTGAVHHDLARRAVVEAALSQS